MKIGELKGHRNIRRIECSCSGISVWIACGNKEFDGKTRKKFIEIHKDHELKAIKVTSTVS